MTRALAPLLLAAFVLAGCLPQVRFPFVGCGGVITDRSTVQSAAHCFAGYYGPYPMRLPSGQLAYAVPVNIDRQNDLASLRPVGLDGRPVELFWPAYGRYEAPEWGDTAVLYGGCALRASPKFEARYWGEAAVPNLPRYFADGVWARWDVVGTGVVCPGDSGSPFWASDATLWGDAPVYYGVGSMYLAQKIYWMERELEVFYPFGTSMATARVEVAP